MMKNHVASSVQEQAEPRSSTGKIQGVGFDPNTGGFSTIAINGTFYPADQVAVFPDMLKVLQDFLTALDAGAVQIDSVEIDLLDDQPPHPWHEEWLHHARSALAKATGGAQ